MKKTAIIVIIILIILIGLYYFIFHLQKPNSFSEKPDETQPENLPFMNATQQNIYETRERDGERLNNVHTIRVGLALYKQEHVSYPPGNSLKLGEPNTACLNDSGWQSLDCSNSYLNPVYKDPLSVKSYLYTQTYSGNSYKIEFEIESDDYFGYKAGMHSIGPDGDIE